MTRTVAASTKRPLATVRVGDRRSTSRRALARSRRSSPPAGSRRSAGPRRRRRVGDRLRERERVVEVAGLDHVEAGERLLGLHERAVGDHVAADRGRRRRSAAARARRRSRRRPRRPLRQRARAPRSPPAGCPPTPPGVSRSKIITAYCGMSPPRRVSSPVPWSVSVSVPWSVSVPSPAAPLSRAGQAHTRARKTPASQSPHARRRGPVAILSEQVQGDPDRAAERVAAVQAVQGVGGPQADELGVR